ncbi:flagellar protein MotY [Paraferrimonas sedimenticola]|uniref:Smf-dependent flagellar motor protein MotY n=1 Tax=Paraferrimonas sedimenticola TaxID=375674 RepID=A0AA37RYV2_9GAMM|nr:smf-dependent flagellar motor protein MotY [Paraferrimonas sedimenticola]
MRRFLVSLCCGLISLSATAELRHYRATLDDSSWQLTRSSRLGCELRHPIPAFGDAVFQAHSGKDHNLLFTLDMQIKPDKVTQAQLVSNAPPWRPGVPSRPIAQLTYHKYFNGEVPKNAAWAMLNELERGMQPTFYYQDWFSQQDQVAVGLSSVRFSQAFADFKQCVANLLPYDFEDIAYTILTYESGGEQLTPASKKQLMRLQEYVMHDPNLELVLVDGYTDSFGSRQSNLKLSQQRANSIKALLVQSGIRQERILTTGHGEKRHVAANNIERERAKNRRVVVRINR